jgi:hypothetical protein
MNVPSIQTQLKSLETQLNVLKAQLTADARADASKYQFADLYGILAGKSTSTDADIAACEYGVPYEVDSGKD